ncbi:MAG TPA: hypothetical protein VN849_07360, partial [Stellaceae bacterium]|nr:hypothetical protein [Stellaceae bacterium]
MHDGHLHRAGICLRASVAGFAETEVSIDHPGGRGGGPPLRDGGPANGDFSTESDTNGILRRLAESGHIEAIGRDRDGPTLAHRRLALGGKGPGI